MASSLGAPALVTLGGASIGIRRSLLHFEESPVHEPITITFSGQADQDDVQEQNTVVDVEPPKPAREIYYNTPCYYFWHSKTGCTRPDCHFLHDEYTVATYKKPTRVPDPEVEVKIFLRNIPPRMNQADIAVLVEPHGYIKWIRLLPSQLESGRQAAIILMTNEAHADAAVEALNAHVDYTGENLSAEKQAVVSLAPAKPATKDDVLPSFSLLGKEREAGRVRDKAPSPTTVYNNPWCVLCDEEDGASRKGKTKKNSEVRPITVPPLAGVWADEVRKIAVMQK
jgi:hypothetical protein